MAHNEAEVGGWISIYWICISRGHVELEFPKYDDVNSDSVQITKM